jgi:two-component system sensor histidine kinase EvgS
VDATNCINKTGTGLGLNLCSTLCRHLGGDIKVTSKLGSYSKFSFFVRDYKANSPEQISNQSNFTQASSERKELSKSIILVNHDINNVLLVDDNPLNLSVGKSMLTKLGEHVLLAYNGEEALTKVMESQDKITLALIDLNMPIMDGYKLCEKLANLMNTNKVPPFRMIALTGEDKDDVIDICKSIGFTDVYMKPLSLRDLKHLIENNAN